MDYREGQKGNNSAQSQYFYQQAPTLGHRVVILAAIVVICSLAYIILGYAAQVTTFLGQTGLRYLSRLLGLLLAVIAVQCILQGVEETVIPSDASVPVGHQECLSIFHLSLVLYSFQTI